MIRLWALALTLLCAQVSHSLHFQPPQIKYRSPLFGRKSPPGGPGDQSPQSLQSLAPRKEPPGLRAGGGRPPSKPSESPGALAQLRLLKQQNNVEEFTRLLKTFASSVPATLDVTDELHELVADWTHQLSPAHLSDWIWSLGKLGFKSYAPRHQTLCMELLHRLCISDGLTARQVTTSFGGLAKIAIRWGSLTPIMQDDITTLVGTVCSSLNDREIGNILHSLSKMAIPWAALPPTVQAGLLESLTRHSKHLISQQGSMAVYSLGTMGLQIDRATPAVRDHVYLISLSVLKQTAHGTHHKYLSQQASNVIYGLAKMGVLMAECPPHVREGILLAVVKVMPQMNEQEVANTVYSLSLMGAQWAQLPGDVTHTIEGTLAQRCSRMITQGVSNTVYGLGVMGLDWSKANPTMRDAAFDAIITCFTADLNPRHSSQAVANVIYALGLSQAVWAEFPPRMSDALVQGLVKCGAYLKSQELSNLIYGLGLLRADFHRLPPAAVDAITDNFCRVSSAMNEQEVCSSLHGLAKMEARWDTMSDKLQTAVLDGATNLSSIGCLCLACTIYSLGLLGAKWSELPPDISRHIILTAQSRPLTDQTLSNTMYGLSLMQAEWDTIDSELKEVLLENLARPHSLGADIPQHVANILWALGKMDATWRQLPGDNLQTSLLRCVGSFKHQESANVIYGLAIVDVPWAELHLEVNLAIEKSIVGCVAQMTIQELANVMYSLALMTFDFDYNVEVVAGAGATQAESLYEQRLRSLWCIHRSVLEAFKNAPPDMFEKENYDQFAIYFELMRSIPVGQQMVLEMFGESPRPSGPSGTVPSRMHAMTVQPMMEKLQQLDPSFNGFNEFCGLNGVFPIDTAVFLKDELVALVEVDGEFHYKLQGQQLRRKDRLKEHLYKHHYPHIPLYRMRSDQLHALGYNKAGEALAYWIARDHAALSV